ncbi:MAG: flagellar biosynthetic protein FliO [Clostridiaceae bacterium]|nr:flagellar biosynthetic protein FliO [Clostridiaceae bacterium]
MEYLKIVLPPLLAVATVIAGAYFAARWVGKRYGSSFGGSIKVVERAVIGRDLQLIIVQVGKKTLLLSGSSKRAELICELDSEDYIVEKTVAKEGDFFKHLSFAVSKKNWHEDSENDTADVSEDDNEQK